MPIRAQFKLAVLLGVFWKSSFTGNSSTR